MQVRVARQLAPLLMVIVTLAYIGRCLCCALPPTLPPLALGAHGGGPAAAHMGHLPAIQPSVPEPAPAPLNGGQCFMTSHAERAAHGAIHVVQEFLLPLLLLIGVTAATVASRLPQIVPLLRLAPAPLLPPPRAA